jgi:hypothetical protein
VYVCNSTGLRLFPRPAYPNRVRRNDCNARCKSTADGIGHILAAALAPPAASRRRMGNLLA